ncbi:MAG: terminase family protein [Candidatus Methanomethylicaceae archaeon]
MARLLTDADKYFLTAALRENKLYHLATEWYLGFKPLPYQYLFHHVKQKNVVFLAGIGAGKTLSATASILMDCLTIPHFKALTTSISAKQAEIMFDKFMEFYENNDRLKHLIADVKLRPYPTIIFQNYSTWEFRTSGTTGQYIRGFEYDRICYDEAGLDFVGEVPKVLRGRLRGKRPDGTARMARLDFISSPTSSPWFIETFNKGWRDHERCDLSQYYSFRITTYQNPHITPEQLKLMESGYTEEEIEVEMMANFPDYSGSMFPRSHIVACTNYSLYDELYEGVSNSKSGYVLEEHPRHGIVRLEFPYNSSHVYVMAGDPGLGEVPKRNAACVIVADISVKPNRVVYFDWISGNGSYMPFLNSCKYAIEKYNPIRRIIDVSSTQKAIQELGFAEAGIETDGISFTSNKDAMLNSLSIMITNHEITFPYIKGMDKQLSSYSREKEDKKMPNDIVMTMAMLAYGIKFFGEEEAEKVSFVPRKSNPYHRHIRNTYSRRR